MSHRPSTIGFETQASAWSATDATSEAQYQSKVLQSPQERPLRAVEQAAGICGLTHRDASGAASHTGRYWGELHCLLDVI